MAEKYRAKRVSVGNEREWNWITEKKCNCYSFDLDCDIMLTMIAAYKRQKLKKMFMHMLLAELCMSEFFMGNWMDFLFAFFLSGSEQFDFAHNWFHYL